MRQSDDSLDAYQIPETREDFNEYERDAKTLLDLMRKWGWTRIERPSLFDVYIYNDNNPITVKPPPPPDRAPDHPPAPGARAPFAEAPTNPRQEPSPSSAGQPA